MSFAGLLSLSFLLLPHTDCRAAGPETLASVLAHSLSAATSASPESASAEAGTALDLNAPAPAVDAGSGDALPRPRRTRPVRVLDSGPGAPKAAAKPADPLEGLPRPSFWEKTKMGFQMGYDMLQFPAQTLWAWKSPAHVLAVPLYILMLPLALAAGVVGIVYNHLRRPS